MQQQKQHHLCSSLPCNQHGVCWLCSMTCRSWSCGCYSRHRQLARHWVQPQVSATQACRQTSRQARGAVCKRGCCDMINFSTSIVNLLAPAAWPISNNGVYMVCCPGCLHVLHRQFLSTLGVEQQVNVAPLFFLHPNFADTSIEAAVLFLLIARLCNMHVKAPVMSGISPLQAVVQGSSQLWHRQCQLPVHSPCNAPAGAAVAAAAAAARLLPPLLPLQAPAHQRPRLSRSSAAADVIDSGRPARCMSCQ